MNSLYILLPISVLLLTIAVVVFLWAIRSGQYDDLQTPALRMLDDEGPESPASADRTSADD